MWSEVAGPITGNVSEGLGSGIVDGLNEVLATNVVGTRFHSMASANINANAGVFVELETAGTLSASKRIRISYTSGQPLQFRKGADATAAAAADDLFVVNQGEDSFDIPVQFSAGERIWVRSLSSTSVTSGYITANFLG